MVCVLFRFNVDDVTCVSVCWRRLVFYIIFNL